MPGVYSSDKVSRPYVVSDIAHQGKRCEDHIYDRDLSVSVKGQANVSSEKQNHKQMLESFLAQH